MTEVFIWIPGEPARVTHQSGTRYANHRTYKTAALKAWESTLAKAIRPSKPDQPLTGPVRLAVTWGYKARKKSDMWKWKLTRPDTDNLQKTLKDVMTKEGFWKDDAQVVYEICKKIWVDQPGIVIKIEELDGRCEDWRIEE